MYKLVKVVTEEMRSQYGSWWPTELTRDLIHAICLDKVRNNNARERTKNRKVPSTEPVLNMTARQNTATKKKRPSRTAASSDDESNVNRDSLNKRAPGTSRMKPLPPTIEPATPTPKASAGALGSKTLLLPPFSPLASSPPLVNGERSPGMYSSAMSLKTKNDQAVQSDLFSSGTTTPATTPTAEQSAIPKLAIYIAGHRPLHLPLNASYSEFKDLVAGVLDWGDKFLLYRPASGSKQELTWRAISIAEDYEKLLKICGGVGVLIKVVEDSWFNSEAESEVSLVSFEPLSHCMYLLIASE